MADAGVVNSPTGAPVVEQQQIASISILLQLVMLGLAFVLGHILRRHKIYYLHEASASLLIGLFAGAVANISNTEERFRQWFNFREEFFFLVLLPPIIFHSGYSLQPKPFFSNFGAICTFAIVGTFLASIITGILVYLGGLFFLMYRLSFQESLIFGSLISATDPVTVLGIFQELGTDVNLYALVFGESVLNDAVAISLYRSFMSIRHNPSTHHSILAGTWRFFEIFGGSMFTGTSVALACALLFKYTGLAVNRLHNLESCLIVLFPYAAYMLAEGLGLSGIVSILFCGILMKHYTFSNLSDSTRSFTAGFFHLISSLAETFVFIYMGVDIAIEKHSWGHVGFIFFSIIFILVARAANVFPCAYIVNFFRSDSRKIPVAHQKALWFGGLRGAMAFALALQSVHDLPDGHGRAIVTATTAIVVVTVLFVGGGISTVLEKLDVVGDNYAPRLSGEILNPEEDQRFKVTSDDDEDDDDGNPEDQDPTHQLKWKLRQFRQEANFEAIDKNFLRPFFTTGTEVRTSDAKKEDVEASPNGSAIRLPTLLIRQSSEVEGGLRRLPSGGSNGTHTTEGNNGGALAVAVELDGIHNSASTPELKDWRQRSLSPSHSRGRDGDAESHVHISD
ncbi:unnamed protein product [Calypogeia fissa]